MQIHFEYHGIIPSKRDSETFEPLGIFIFISNLPSKNWRFSVFLFYDKIIEITYYYAIIILNLWLMKRKI